MDIWKTRSGLRTFFFVMSMTPFLPETKQYTATKDLKLVTLNSSEVGYLIGANIKDNLN